ncbi:Ribokinase-like protein [Gorgonomyces haynaldii]|nr:Ribokinase-like protein [Gorgonomyces haynaldii]
MNTVQLSNHTGYPHFKGERFNDKQLDTLFTGLELNGFLSSYTHILTGYVGQKGALEKIREWIHKIKQSHPQVFVLVDPVLGDNGKLYVPQEFVHIYKTGLLPLADLITPNGYEAQWLTGIELSPDNVKQVLDQLHQMGPKRVVITSIEFDGVLYIYGSDSTSVFRIRVPKISYHFTGTGLQIDSR